ncbi:hypothetical protein ACIO1C_27495 [Streptomyces sp. NPDC087420]
MTDWLGTLAPLFTTVVTAIAVVASNNMVADWFRKWRDRRKNRAR